LGAKRAPILLGTRSWGKRRELSEIFQDFDFEVVDLETAGIAYNEAEDEVESYGTFEENALAKARYFNQLSGMPTIADDSGLVVPALNGAPGIYSARYAGTPQNSEKNIEKLLTALIHQPDRCAWFHCSLIFLRHAYDPTPIIAEGQWHGSILFAAQGKNGFGYDPIFFDPTTQRSAAELSPDEKNQISHRGQALKHLLYFLSQFEKIRV